MPPTLRPIPLELAGYERAYRFDPDAEMLFKGMELRASEIRIRRGHDFVHHAYLDTPGGTTEVTGRKSYIIEAKLEFCGDQWQGRLANAMNEHDTGADVEGELVVPDGPIIDAKWLDCDELWSGKKGKTVSAVFYEQGFSDTHFVQVPPPLQRMRSSIPDEDSATLEPLVETYASSIATTSQDAVAVMVAALVALDNAATTAQAACDMTTATGFDRFTGLMAVRANARRAFPVAAGINLAVVLR